MLERHRLFPERANIEVAQDHQPPSASACGWERSAGITQACGSGAPARPRRGAGLTGRSANVVLDGGELLIEWLPDNHVRMTGGWAESFRGEIDLAWLERAVA